MAYIDESGEVRDPAFREIVDTNFQKEEATKKMQAEINYQREQILELKSTLSAIRRLATS